MSAIAMMMDEAKKHIERLELRAVYYGEPTAHDSGDKHIAYNTTIAVRLLWEVVDRLITERAEKQAALESALEALKS